MTDPPTDVHKLTYEDYCAIPEDGKRHEILDGKHYVSPAPGSYHQSLVLRLGALLWFQVEKAGLGRVLPSPIDLQLSEHDIAQPDLLAVVGEHRRFITPTKVKGPPDLIIEVLSPSTEKRDRGLKKKRYGVLGVREYWIVDPAEHVVEQYLLEEEAWRLLGVHADGIRPHVLPEVCLDLREVW